MKILYVSDPSIPNVVMREAFEERFRQSGHVVCGISWGLCDMEELDEQNRIIEKAGPEAVHPPAAIFHEIEDSDILVVDFCPVSREVMTAGKNLKLVGCLRTTVRSIDLAEARRRNILVLNTVGRTADAVSDFTIGLMISELRNIARSHSAMKAGQWQKSFANEEHCYNLTGKTVGLVGFGHVARKVARKLSGFDVRLLAFDPFIPEEEMKTAGVTPVSLECLLRESDIVSVHAGLSEGTRNLIDERRLGMMKSSAYLVNTSRAEIVDEKALVRALAHKKLAGAAIDVFVDEPLESNSKFLSLENVTLTSHLAGATKNTGQISVELLASDIERWLRGSLPLNIVE